MNNVCASHLEYFGLFFLLRSPPLTLLPPHRFYICIPGWLRLKSLLPWPFKWYDHEIVSHHTWLDSELLRLIFYYFYLRVSVWVYTMCVQIAEAARMGHQIPWGCSYRQLRAARLKCWKPNSCPLEKKQPVFSSFWFFFRQFWDWIQSQIQTNQSWLGMS